MLLLPLWPSPAPGTLFLRWGLAAGAVAHAFAYGLPSPFNHVPGTIEFFRLPLLLVGVGLAARRQRGNGLWSWLVGACIPLAGVSMAIVQYWQHGALLPVGVACCLLTWAPRPPKTDDS